jgi:hypothetical protein
MKNKLMIFVLILCNFAAKGQTKTDSIPKSLVTILVDSVQNKQIENLNKRLTQYYQSNKSSQFFYGAALVFGTLAVLIPPVQQTDQKIAPVNGFGIGAFLFGVIGTKIYFDSFKPLNINPKPKANKKLKK